MENIPVVAIWMVTYNHGNYIQQAIESVMSQQTNFSYKLIIGEDCSTDNTRAICQAMKEQYPDKIELVLREKNVGASQNGIEIYKRCFESSAKYIAMLEGDDYWTDKQKLQKQVDFLDSNPDFAMCFHEIAREVNGKVEATKDTFKKDVFDIHDYAREGFVQTSTMLYRNFGFDNFPHYLSKCYAGDSVITLASAKRGLLKLIPEVMSVYRIHETGIWSMQDKAYLREKRVKDILTILDNEQGLDEKFKSIMKEKLFKEYRFLYGATGKWSYNLAAFRLNPTLTAKLTLKQLIKKQDS